MIRVLTTAYNTERYIGMCIQSLKAQTEKNFKVYITNDISTDRTEEIALKNIDGDERFEIINNKTKFYQPGNYWQILQREEVKDEDICITVDGDDWLPNEDVFARVLEYYKNPDIWLTFGQFVYYDGGKYPRGFCRKPNPFKPREQQWTSTHLRTFKSFLFRKIQKESLIAPNGNFWETTGDMACWSPMMEMAGESRILYSEDINYVYNADNPLCDFRANLQTQCAYDRLIRQLKPYKEL